MKTREHRLGCGRTGAPSLRNFLLVSAIAALTISQQLAQAKETTTKTAAGPTKTTEEAKEVKAREDSPALDKKQGDQIDSLFNTDEYVQIKPEEIGAGEPGKELEAATLSLADLSSGSSSESGAKSGAASAQAEHKSADDELNAQLAQDSISTMESGNRAYAAAPAPLAADPRAARPQYPPARGGYLPSRGPHNYPRPPMGPYGGPPPRAPRPPPAYGMPLRPPMHPSSGYLALKGKIADGISSMVPQVSRPYGAGPVHAPAHPSPYGSPRYLPRGAAAGYAAFREFVRAQAHRYKQQGGLGSPEPLAYNAAPPAGPSYGASAGYPQLPPAPPSGTEYRQPAAPSSYGPGPVPAPATYGQAAKPESAYSGEAPAGYGAAAPAAKPAQKAKVTVAQAYIPHLAPALGAGAYGKPESAAGEQGAYPTNPVLSKLYGGQAPEAHGRPAYSKDYGMVIHYPQATVYTEPMTVDQLHKLAGSSITQVLEHLQYNIANGQRDESNTIRANKKHHLGHGLSIHAKEYLAPGKSGHYVPTTAAVISSSSPPPNKGPAYAGPDEPAQAGYGNAPGSVSGSYGPAPVAPAEPHPEASGYGLKPELGAGYERVKAAVAASSTNYNQPPKPIEFYNRPSGSGHPPGPAANAGYASGPPPAAPQPSDGKYEPLGQIASIIGNELESLYNKANSVLSKQIDPEIHAHVQAHLKSLSKQIGPVKISEHDYKSPLVLSPLAGGEGRAPRPYGPPGSAGGNAYPRPATPPYHPRGRSPRRPQYPAPQQGRPSGRQPHRAPGHYNQYRARPQQSQAYQQQTYNAAEQKELAQIMHEFQLGDDQYAPKSRPVQASNQGYPSKLMQKQQPQQYQAPSSLPYDHSDGLELPQGANDQIGEIGELMDALKGTLEAHKNEAGAAGYGQPAAKDHGKVEDVRYLASALGQVPSYAIQVPVSHPQQSAHPSSAENAVSEAAKKAEQQQQNYAPQPQQPYGQAQQQQQYGQQAGYQQPAQTGGYQAPGASQQQAYQPQYQAPGQAQQHSAPQTSNYGLGQSEQAAYQTHDTASYGQQLQTQQYQQPSGGYGQPAAQAPAQAYSVSSQQLEINHIAPAQQTGAYAAPAPVAQQVDSYGQQRAPASDYQQPAGEQPAQASYAAPAAAPSPVAHQQAQEAYQQQPLSAVDQPISQQAYSNVETSQVINHLVPVQQQAAPAPSSNVYQQPSSTQHGQQLAAVTSDVTHQPANQIGLAEPTDSQYQSAQPLSSFVDSLPSDYQELLRQPAGHSAILEGAASTQHESSSAAEPASAKTGASSARSNASASSASSSSHRNKQTADQHSAASSFSSTYQQPLSAKAAAYHSSSSSSSSPSSSAAAKSSSPSSTSEQTSDTQASSSAFKSSAAASKS